MSALKMAGFMPICLLKVELRKPLCPFHKISLISPAVP